MSSSVSEPLCFTGCLLLAVILMVGCDSLGGNDDSNEESDEIPLATLWNGTYEGQGRELDYYDGSANDAAITPTLTVALLNAQSLERLRLSWNDNSNYAETTGAIDTLARDTLVTAFESVDADSFKTQFRFRLGRDSVASGDSVRIRGRMKQTYDGTTVDSTIVRFTVARATESP